MKATQLHDKEILLATIGQNIKTLIEENGNERKKLADYLSITPQALGHIEKGKTDLTISRIVQFAEYFDVPFDKIISSDNSKYFHVINSKNKHCTINNANHIESQLIDESKINAIGQSIYNAMKSFFIVEKESQ